MNYNTKPTFRNPIYQKEYNLLHAGFSYAETARITGTPITSLMQRNRKVYKINLRRAFKRKLKREGIPDRLSITDTFGFWFSGFFDGEGCFYLLTRKGKKGYIEHRIGIAIVLRADDILLLQQIRETLEVGVLYQNKKQGNANPSATYRCEKVADLAEVFIPLFDKYPLRSRKRQEYPFWRRAVLFKYTNTLGGRCAGLPISEKQNTFFEKCQQQIHNIRAYPTNY